MLPFLSLISDPPLLPIQGCCTGFSVCDRCFSLNTIIPQCPLIPIGDTHRRVDHDVEWIVVGLVVESQRAKAKLSSPFTNKSKKMPARKPPLTPDQRRIRVGIIGVFLINTSDSRRLRFEEDSIRGGLQEAFVLFLCHDRVND